MFRITRSVLFLVLLLLLLVPSIVQAQEVPLVIDLALADLSERVGLPVTLNNLWAWQWEGQIFPDTSLGCPQPGETYAPVMTGGVRFLLDYLGTIYDYRVSTDGTIVIFCGVESEAVTSAPAPQITPPVVISEDACAGLLFSRLTVGEDAIILPDVSRLNLRQQPDITSAVIGRIPGSSLIHVVGGPECDPVAGIVWWQVRFGDQTGWAAESQRNLYFISPVTDELIPVTPEPAAIIAEPAEGEAICPDLPPSHLAVGQEVRVTLSDIARLNLRGEPGLSSPVIGVVQNGNIVTVVDGPACGPDNIIWWQVDYQGVIGWAAENVDSFYILAPLDTSQ
ncbi:MAG TPA: SH3 domain-containing protein [Spirillospora sp.]|nr:SH3 domain-containing protein [Spirillospora sp.]